MLRLGLIGLGRHGVRYAEHLARGDVEGVTLAAVWRRDREKGREIAERVRARFEPSVEALIGAPDVDALAVVVPAAFHEELAVQIAAAGRPLLLEKPMARTVGEGIRIVEAFRRAGRTLMIAQTLRFDPLTVMLRERGRALGEVRGFRFEQRIEPRGLAWEDEPALSGGGVLIQTAIHTFDALRFTTECDDVRIVRAAMGRVQYEHNEDHGIVVAALGREGRVIGDVAVSKIGRSRHMRFVLFYEDAAIEADYVARTFTETRLRDRDVTHVPDCATVVSVIEAFARAIEGRAPNPVPGEDALRSLALVEQAYALAR